MTRETARASARIKCCGMFRPEDIAAVNAALPDYCGFIVNFPRSHRSITAARLLELRALLDDTVAAVGVFVDEDPRVVAKTAASAELALVQLHGHEDEGYIATLRQLTDTPLVKAFKIRGAADLAAARESSADYVLLDNGYGTGRAFDWTLLDDGAGALSRPFFLAGGLTCENIGEALCRFGPFAVDMSSGLETNKIKDPEKIRAAVQAVRGASCN